MQLAGCIIKNKEGKMLLLHRNTAKRMWWEIPGGKLHAGETPEQAAVRELAEELGVTVRLTGHLGGKTFEENGEHHQYDWFDAEIISGEPRLAETRTFESHGYTFDGLDYFSLEEMHQMFDELSPNAQNFVIQSLQA